MRKITLCCIVLLSSTLAVKSQSELIVYDDLAGQEQTIGMPESMEQDLDQLLATWNAKNYINQFDDCNHSTENPFFSQDVYIDRLKRLPHTMEMSYNEVVQKFIDQYCGRLRRSISYMLGAQNFYTPLFEEVLDLYGLPLELKYLPIIESALNPSATSRSGAAGLWQFMLATGQRYGLEITSLIDERRDPIKSSHAAAQYLRDLYNIYGDWNLVIAAYNCGPGNVNKAIARASGAKDYWVIYPYLPKETRGYVPAFIATNYIMNYYCEHNICPVEVNLPLSTDTIQVNKDLHFQQIADLCSVSLDEVKMLNPQYRTEVIPGGIKPSTLRLPQSSISTFLSMQDTIYLHRANELFARRSVAEVKSVPSSSQKPTKKMASTKRRTVVVKKGDTLGTIAERNKTTVKKLQALNGLKGTAIRSGQSLRVL